MEYSTKEIIVTYLEGRGNWIWGGELARAIHEITGTKESIIERRARELANSGMIEHIYEQVEGKGPKCVKFKIREPELVPQQTILL